MTKTNPLPGIPPNMSVLAAMSAGLLPANVQLTNFGTGGPNHTLLSDLSGGDAPGYGTVPSDLSANAAASAVTFSAPPAYGGD